MIFKVANKLEVANRGSAPESFLLTLVTWAKSADETIFAQNQERDDIFNLVKHELGPWTSLSKRKAALCEVMRVHAGFESSWNWNEGVDFSNKHSLEHTTGQETGIFQVSFDSSYLGQGRMKPFLALQGIETVLGFISQMKSDHQLALEYYARLVRFNTRDRKSVV